MEKLRREQKIIFVATLIATASFYQQINWIHYLLLFWVIDIFGYWPGLIYTKVSKKEIIHPIFYRIYNTMHDLSTIFIIAIAYISWSDAPYSILGVCLHVSIDRGLLGNYHKNSTYKFKEGGLQS